MHYYFKAPTISKLLLVKMVLTATILLVVLNLCQAVPSNFTNHQSIDESINHNSINHLKRNHCYIENLSQNYSVDEVDNSSHQQELNILELGFGCGRHVMFMKEKPFFGRIILITD